LRWQKNAILDDEPREVFSVRSEVVQRLLAKHCELCGANDNCQVHHVRKLADQTPTITNPRTAVAMPVITANHRAHVGGLDRST
jgi:hypothetical protein